MSELERFKSTFLDSIIGEKFKVLDDGFVRVVDYMGSDSSIVQAARVSYGGGTKKVSEDKSLIRYLVRNYHTSPLEMCSIKLHIRAPMDCWRQWVRHRTAKINEVSTRYSVVDESWQITGPSEWRLQAKDNKQGSDGYLDTDTGEDISLAEAVHNQKTHDIYKKMLELGIAREQARKILPLSTYTEAYWKIDLHNLLHFLRLRMDPHAQQEIRDYATTIGEKIVAHWVPMTWDAFKDYRLDSISLSRLEAQIIAAIGVTGTGAINLATDFGWLQRDKNGNLKRNREREELEAKLAILSLPVPWKSMK